MSSESRIGDYDLSFSYRSDFARVPEELRDLRQWIGWKFKDKGNGKLSKVPCSAVDGGPVGVTRERKNGGGRHDHRWCTFEEALEGAESHGLDGIGFVFTADSGYVGVDIDGAFATPERLARTEAAVAELGTYTEISPSGEGLHLILRGELPPGASFCHSGTDEGSGFECYADARYFTFTGLLYRGHGTINSNQPALRALVEREIGHWPEPGEDAPAQEPASPPGVPSLVPRSTLPPIPEKWQVYFEEGSKYDGADSNVTWINIAEDLFRHRWTESQVLTALCQPGPISERLYSTRGAGSAAGAISWMWRYIVSRAYKNIVVSEREALAMFSPVEDYEQVEADIRAAAPAAREQEPQGSEDGPGGSTIVLIQPPEVAHLPVPPRAWLMRDFVPHGEVCAIYGDGGVGKSYLTLQLACAILRGEPFLGRHLEVEGPVMAFYCEDDVFEIRRRLRAIGEVVAPAKTGEEFEQTLSGLMFQSRRSLPSELATFDTGGQAKKTDFFHELKVAVMKIRPSVLILDSLYNFFVGNMNDSAQVRQFITYLSELADLGTTVILVSHPSQSGKNSGEGTAGSVAWNNGVRSRLYLHASEDDPAGIIRLSRMKGNYAGTDSESVIKLVKRGSVFVPWTGEELPKEEAEEFVSEIGDLIDVAVTMLGLGQIPRADRRSPDWLVLHTVEESGKYRGKRKEAGIERYIAAVVHATNTGQLAKVQYWDGKQSRVALVPCGMEERVPGRVDRMPGEEVHEEE